MTLTTNASAETKGVGDKVRTFDEYRRRYRPKARAREFASADDAGEFGRLVGRESLDKLRGMLSAKK